MTSDEFELHVGRGWLTSENALVKYVNRNDANGYYKALGLSPDASVEQIKAAYRRLAKRLHPDRGGDEEVFRFLVDIVSVLLDPALKSAYDSVEEDSVYLGRMELEELYRSGAFKNQIEELRREEPKQYWACVTTPGFFPGEDTDAWIDLCRQVASSVGHRGKIRVGVLEGGRHWPCNPSRPWGILAADSYLFLVFQRGIEPNRLYALCAMIEWQRHLLNQTRASAQDRERSSWL